MTLIVITDTVPSRATERGAGLLKLCEELRPHEVAFFCIVESGEKAVPDPEHRHRTVIARRGSESRSSRLPGRLGSLSALLNELACTARTLPDLQDQFIRLARATRARAVWCMVNGQTTLRLAHWLSEAFAFPLFVEVREAPRKWMRERGLDRFTLAALDRMFEQVLRRAKLCLAESPIQADAFARMFGCRVVALGPALDRSWAMPPAQGVRDDSFVTLALGGSVPFYEWNFLFQTLEYVGLRVGGRRIRVKVFGHSVWAPANAPVDVEFAGWYEPREVIRQLSRCDILYCAQAFQPVQREIVSLDAPQKLGAYLAAGRPILLHMPEHAASVKYLRAHGAAAVCSFVARAAIYHAIDRLIFDREHYSSLAANGVRLFEREFTGDARARHIRSVLDGIEVPPQRSGAVSAG